MKKILAAGAAAVAAATANALGATAPASDKATAPTRAARQPGGGRARAARDLAAKLRANQKIPTLAVETRQIRRAKNRDVAKTYRLTDAERGRQRMVPINGKRHLSASTQQAMRQ